MTIWIDPTPTDNLTILPGYHPFIQQALIKKGIKDPGKAKGFLDPESYSESDSTELPGLANTVDRLVHSIKTQEPVCVWGDFDVDGQTSTTVLVQTLKQLGADVKFHIPIRKNESHGINIENLSKVIADGSKLIITCDTGISAVEAAAYARARDIELLITDHHDLPEQLPDANQIVNPKMLRKDHPLSGLAGVGVAYKVAEELIKQLQPGHFSTDDLLDITALGLVADLAVQQDDTRCLVQKGLIQLRRTKRLGLKTLMELAELSPGSLTEEHIGFTIGPRLNAIGRLGDANPIVEFLTTSDPVKTRVIATQLEALNVDRKLKCDQVYKAAEAQLSADKKLAEQPLIILSHPKWPGGVIGIVASKIAEKYHKPVILFTTNDGSIAKGSARSIEGVNITEAIAAQQKMLLGFGGHPMAAGLSLAADKLPEFRKKIGRTIETMLGDSAKEEGTIEIDHWISLEDSAQELCEQIEFLAPFGPGNPKLTFGSKDLTLQNASKIGKNGEHLKLTVSGDNGTIRQLMWWDGGNEEIPSGKFDLAYTLRASDWKGTAQIQLEYIDHRTNRSEMIEVKTAKIIIRDLRNCETPEIILSELINNHHSIIWAEGIEKKNINGVDRYNLVQADQLFVWSLPASMQDLRAAIETVKPGEIFIFSRSPGSEELKPFLERLAGLLKFALIHKNGNVTISQLASATGQKESAVRIGLTYLSNTGVISIVSQNNDDYTISAPVINTSFYQDTSLPILEKILQETKAFRKFFVEQDFSSLEKMITL